MKVFVTGGAFWARTSKANKQLNWQANRNLEQMMVDTWRWQSNNPNGFQSLFSG